MSSSEDLDSILERLNTLSEEEEMDIGDIVKAVVGKESDEELEDWVRAAFEDIDRSLNLV